MRLQERESGSVYCKTEGEEGAEESAILDLQIYTLCERLAGYLNAWG